MSKDRELMEKVSGEEKPTEAGNYITNFGLTKFDGKNFLMPGHKKPTTTVVEWWLTAHKPE